MSSRTAPSLLRRIALPTTRRMSTTPRLAATSPMSSSYDSTKVNRTTSIFPDRGANRGSNETRPLSQRIFGAPKGAALSETIEASEGGGPANWVGMKRSQQQGQVSYLEEGRLGWWVTKEERDRATMEGMLAGLQAGIAAGGKRMGGEGLMGVASHSGQDTITNGRVNVLPEHGTVPAESTGFVFGRGDERKSM